MSKRKKSKSEKRTKQLSFFGVILILLGTILTSLPQFSRPTIMHSFFLADSLDEARLEYPGEVVLSAAKPLLNIQDYLDIYFNKNNQVVIWYNQEAPDEHMSRSYLEEGIFVKIQKVNKIKNYSGTGLLIIGSLLEVFCTADSLFAKKRWWKKLRNAIASTGRGIQCS